MKITLHKKEILQKYGFPEYAELEIIGNMPADTTCKDSLQVGTSWATITDGPGKKTSELVEECKKLFKVWSTYSYEELDKFCPEPKETITKVYKESIEPDCLNMSYNDAMEKGIHFMSARERIILELQYFKETGKGLDIKGWTITSTLDSDGDAMHMCRFSNGQFCMDRSYRDIRYSGHGPRQLVS